MKRKIVKSFDLEAAKNGAKIETRNGKEVEILRWDLNNKCPILGIVTGDDGYESFAGWGNDGTSPFKMDIDNDLVIVEYENDKSEDEKMLNNIEECLWPFYKKSEYREIYDWIKEKKEESSRKECTESWWVARDKNNTLYIYENRPTYMNDSEFSCNYIIELNKNLFPELTWKNSPQKIKVNIELMPDENKEDK